MIRPETDLPNALKEQFKFTPDSTGQWLQSDEFEHPVGGIEEGEWIPTRARVLSDGTRFEIGARAVDLMGLLELSRITRLGVISSAEEGYDRLRNFWITPPATRREAKEHPVVKVEEEDDVLFIGIDVEPTARGLEARINEISLAYDTALHAAIEGKTYTQMRRDKWYGSTIKQILNVFEDQNGSSGIFSYTREESIQEGAVCVPRPVVTVDTLKDFPLETSRTSLHNLPGKMVAPDGSIRELDDVMIMANNGQPTVFINDSDTNYDHDREIWTHNPTKVQLVIPDGVEIKTVADLAKLQRAQVEITTDKYTEEKAYSELDVEITVEDNLIRIVAQDPDNPFNMEIRTLACTDCQMPYWKFPWPDPETGEKDWNPYAEFRMHSTRSGGVHGYQCFVEREDGKQDIYCLDCVTKLENNYLEEHPDARRSRAMEITRARLDEMGYPDVQIWDTQVWRAGFEYPEEKGNGWELYTKIEYERDGRKIIRHTGIPLLTDGGEFKPNLLPDEYIRFRYKVD